MMNGITRHFNEGNRQNRRRSEMCARWLATAVDNDISQHIPDFNDRVKAAIKQEPSLGCEIKSQLANRCDKKFTDMMDEFDHSIDFGDITFCIKKQGDKFVHFDTDPELCYHLGFTSGQFNHNELSPEIIPAELIPLKLSYYERAWNGETVDYYGYGKADQHYKAKLTPVYQDGKISHIHAAARFQNDAAKKKEAKRSNISFIGYHIKSKAHMIIAAAVGMHAVGTHAFGNQFTRFSGGITVALESLSIFLS